MNISLVLPSASALSTLAGVAWLFLTDKVVTRGRLDDAIKAGDKSVARAEAETERWRQAYEFSEQARHVDAGHVGQLLANTTAVVAALPPAPTGGGSDAAAVA